MTEKLYGYVCFYSGKRVEVYAKSILSAKEMVVKQLKVPPKKTHMVSVFLCEDENGNTVTHSTLEL